MEPFFTFRWLLVWAIACGGYPKTSLFGFCGNDNTSILWHHRTNGLNVAWEMNGVRYNVNTQSILSCNSTAWQAVATADFNLDGHTDILWRMPSTGQNAIWLMTNHIFGSGFIITRGSSDYRVVGTGDFNQDGYADILWNRIGTDKNVVWFMNGTNFSGAIGWLPSQPDPAWKPVATGDWNHDEKTDVLWRNQTDGRLCIWSMKGTNLVSTSILDVRLHDPGMTNQNWQVAATGDFTHVGECEILWRNRQNGLNTLWLLKDGQYAGSCPLPQVSDLNWVIAGTGGFRSHAQIMASASASPPQLTLAWRWGGPRVNISRRLVGQSAWTTLATGVQTKSYLDTNLIVGQRYEYTVNDGRGIQQGWNDGYLAAGINLPPIDNRGRLLLVLESSLTNSSAFNLEISRFKTNLVLDGWSVSTTFAARHDDTNWAANTNAIRTLKAVITNFYHRAAAETHVVFLVGHVAIPYSGSGAEDGHRGPDPAIDHRGAWPVDLYYADLDEALWTDSTVNFTNIAYPSLSNFPHDGKFDNNPPPSALELGIGRIDFANLPWFYHPPNGAPPKSEVDLIVQYLQKNHRYRHKLTALPAQAIGGGFYGNLASMNADKCAISAKLSSRWFGWGPNRLFSGDLFCVTNQPVLFAEMGGFGAYQAVQGSNGIQRLSLDLTDPLKEPKAGFCELYGSWFIDWNFMTNNLLRSLLATPNYNLAVFRGALKGGELLGLGDPLFSSLKRTVQVEHPYGARSHAILGDPTLRLQTLRPATHLTCGGTTPVNLSWDPSPEATHYWVFRSTNGVFGQWTRITPGPIPSTSCSDDPGPARPVHYQVRSLKLIHTGSGSFTNVSQGVLTVLP
ncbi:MAG TPA: VCBS repeat-containing protein [Candidatus Paceibacterota bacterium]|nr:VCBS repeat-containing protein [Candidatus Paceibacterota bacterium]